MAQVSGVADTATQHVGSLLTGELRRLFDNCPGCGWPTSQPQGPCPGCGGSPTVDAGQPDDLHPLLGRAVRGPKLSTGEEGVVAEVHSGGATIICADGTAIRARVKKCRLTQNPPGRAGMRSAAGALISAALGLSLPPAASQELHRRALALAGLSPGGFRALAADCATLGRAEPLAALPLPEPERTWWTARAMWTAGQPAAAATRLLDLPAGRYPARIALWWQTVTAGLLPEALRSPVAMATREFPPAPPAVALAASLLLRTLGERTGVASDAALVDAVRALGGDQVASWLDGRAGDSSAARLLAALSGAIGVAELGTDPAFPDAVPMPVLDDLADLGRIPQAWLASKRVGGYLRCPHRHRHTGRRPAGLDGRARRARPPRHTNRPPVPRRPPARGGGPVRAAAGGPGRRRGRAAGARRGGRHGHRRAPRRPGRPGWPPCRAVTGRPVRSAAPARTQHRRPAGLAGGTARRPGSVASPPAWRYGGRGPCCTHGNGQGRWRRLAPACCSPGMRRCGTRPTT